MHPAICWVVYHPPLRSTNTANGTKLVSTNNEMAKIKKRMAAAVIATPPEADARLRNNFIVFFSDLKMVGLDSLNVQLTFNNKPTVAAAMTIAVIHGINCRMVLPWLRPLSRAVSARLMPLLVDSRRSLTSFHRRVECS
jgi:hypothetical protein